MSGSKLVTNAYRDLFSSSRVLVVDDSITIRMILSSILKEQGFAEIMLAENGEDALAKLASFVPDIIILDIAMPNIDGLKFCEKFRNSDFACRNIPIIIMTGLAKTDERMSALRVGASSILDKPIDKGILAERMYAHLQESRLINKINNGEVATEEDLTIAEQILATLLPSKDIIEECQAKYNIDIGCIYQPSEIFGGDYCTVKPINEHLLAVFVADFAGHGVSSAVYVLRLHKFFQEYIIHYQSPAEVLNALNQAACKMFPAGKYLTCVLAFIDIKQNVITYSSAGHPPMILISDTVNYIDCSGTPVGAYSDARYTDKIIPFNKKNVLAIYSDALIEANNDLKILFNQNSLAEQIKETSNKGVYIICNEMLSTIKKAEHHFDDDMTFLCLMRN